VVRKIASTIEALRREGATIVLVERMATIALKPADRAYVLENGPREAQRHRPRARPRP
jgi:branched-chain amino acid transport system ATP-binding protein